MANIYLHYVLDLWVHQWRKTKARGDVIVVRFADDFVVGFQHRPDAERLRKDLEERFTKFKLRLHPEKTRLIEFGYFAADNRRRRGQGKPETFNFLVVIVIPTPTLSFVIVSSETQSRRKYRNDK
jgi:hypothetical protein